MERTDFQKIVEEKAVSTGFSDYEVYCEGEKSFEVLIYDGEVSHYENSILKGVSFRGIYKNNVGYAYTERMDEMSAEFLVQQAKQNAEIMEEEIEEELYAGDINYPQIKGFNKELEQVTVKERIQSAMQMELAAKEEDETVAAIDYCLLGYSENMVFIKNSKGLDISFKSNFGTAYVSAIAQKNGDVKTGSEYWADNKWSTFQPKNTGRQAAKIAVSHLGAYSISSGEYRVILENIVSAELLQTFCGIFFGENVQKGFSLLQDKKGEKIASSKITIRDDAILENNVGSVPFDSEGVKCRNKTIIEEGKLKTFLYNLKTAYKDGVSSTGNGFRASYRSSVQTTCTNFYIEKSGKSPKMLLAMLGDGLYITEIAGLHSGANTISGDFSLSAEGFYVEKGKIKRPVEQITIAGNFYEMLKNIEEVGSDLRFIMPSAVGRIGSPMILVKKMAISGI